MLSYKQWKMLNESVLPSFTLGVANPSNLGLNAPSGFGMDILEAKKKSKKKMDLGGEDDETGDGETVEPSSPKDDPDVDVDVDVHDDDAAIEDGQGCDSMCGKGSKKNCKKSKKNCKKSKKKMDVDVSDDGDQPDDSGDEDEGEGDDDGDDVELAGKGGDVGGGMGDAGPMFSKKKSKKAGKKMKAEASEEDAWWASVKSMVGPAPNTKYKDGWSEYQEDALFTPVDTDNLTQAVRPEPGPGEPGFAPTGRVGGF
jgi:hypothetical protein